MILGGNCTLAGLKVSTPICYEGQSSLLGRQPALQQRPIFCSFWLDQPSVPFDHLPGVSERPLDDISRAVLWVLLGFTPGSGVP